MYERLRLQGLFSLEKAEGGSHQYGWTIDGKHQWRQTLPSCAQQKDMRQWAQIIIQGTQFESKKIISFSFFLSPYCQGGHTWNRLPREVVASPSKPGGHSSKQNAGAWKWTKQSPEIPSSLSYSMITSNQLKQSSWKNYNSSKKYSKAA